MYGAIFGDIAGSAYEFHPTHDYNFDLITQDSMFTDDTICTMAIADAFMNGRPYRTSLLSWCSAYPHPMGGYGGRFYEWLHSKNPTAYYSWGNGSAMRVSALGWLCSDLDETLQEATYSAACTHNHPDAIRGAQAVAAAVYLARTGVCKDVILKFVEQTFCYDLSGDLSIFRGKFDESCNGTVPAAFLCIRDSHDFESAIRLAVSLGADADTLGAIVGAIAEPLYGMPEEYKAIVRDFLASEPQMLEVLQQFKERIKV